LDEWHKTRDFKIIFDSYFRHHDFRGLRKQAFVFSDVMAR